MSLFLAGVALLGIVAALIAADHRRLTARDTLGLRAARREVAGRVRRDVIRQRLYALDRLRVPRSFLENALVEQEGRRRLEEFHREDR